MTTAPKAHRCRSLTLKLGQELISLIKGRMKTKTVSEWMEPSLVSGNVCGDVMQTTQEALRHTQIAATAATIEVEDTQLGPMLQIGG